MTDYRSIIKDIQKDFPFFETPMGQTWSYLDNAATTLKPKPVLEAIKQYDTEYTANVHRAVFDSSQKASSAYEKARETIAAFIGGKPEETIFTSGATAGINLFAQSFAEVFLKKGDRIVLSHMEHHANLLPWQKIAKQFECELAFIPMTQDGTLDLSNLDSILTDNTKLLAIIAVSNTLGTVNPIDIITKKCKEKGIITFVDAAQSIVHQPYDLDKSDIDFLVFSGHKIFGPTGIGILWGRKELLNKLPPFFYGGGIVHEVTLESATFDNAPIRFEAGTPPIAQAIGLGKAIEYFQQIGWDTIHAIKKQHLHLGLECFEKFNEYMILYGISPERTPIFSFKVNQVHPHDVGSFLNEMKIAVRTGHQCTQPIWKFFGISSVTRASASIYNMPEEWDHFSKSLNSLLEFFHVGKLS